MRAPRLLLRCLGVILMLLLSMPVSAEESDTVVSRPVTQVYSLEAGGAMMLDTYLSRLHFRGESLALTGQWSKAMPFSSRWTMSFDARTALDAGLSPSGASAMYGLEMAFGWGMDRRWRLFRKLTLSAGGSIGFDGGVLYLPRNTNNPAAAKMYAGMSLRFGAAMPLTLGRLHLLLSDRVTLPTLGAFFSPAYGESYYEIYLGNHAGLAHFGWWGNHFCADNLLSVDFDFGRTAMRVGYRYRIRTSYVNHLNSQVATHAFVIGVIPHGLGLKPRKPSAAAVTISAMY